MKKIDRAILLVFISLLAITGVSGNETKRDSIKILTIGNSFTANAVEYLPSFAHVAEKELLHFPANIGGASFERHVRFLEAYEANPESSDGRPYKNVTDPQTGKKRDFSLREALEADNWDIVTIQQVSSQSFRPETFAPAHRLIAYIRQHAPQSEILIHQTWAYHADYEGYQKEDFNADIMHERLTAAYRSLAEQYQIKLIPVGNAFHAARQTPRWTYRKDPNFDYENPKPRTLPDQSTSLNVGYFWRARSTGPVFHLDYRHANDAGKYLGAAVWFEFLFGEPAPANAPIPETLTPEDAAQLRHLAHQTVQSEHNL